MSWRSGEWGMHDAMDAWMDLGRERYSVSPCIHTWMDIWVAQPTHPTKALVGPHCGITFIERFVLLKPYIPPFLEEHTGFCERQWRGHLISLYADGE